MKRRMLLAGVFVFLLFGAVAADVAVAANTPCTSTALNMARACSIFSQSRNHNRVAALDPLLAEPTT